MESRLTDFFRYNLWANLNIIDVCSKLSDTQLDFTIDGVYGSVWETLVHIVASEEGYARHFNLTGPAPMPPLKEFTTYVGFEELRRRAERSGKELLAVAQQADLSQVLHLDDGTYDAELIIVLMQAVNHGVDHRSQISTLLTQEGITPPNLDTWAYNDFIRGRK